MHHLYVFIVRLPSLPHDLCISGLAIALYALANPPVKRLLSWRQTGYTHRAPCLDWGFHCLVLEFLQKHQHLPAQEDNLGGGGEFWLTFQLNHLVNSELPVISWNLGFPYSIPTSNICTCCFCEYFHSQSLILLEILMKGKKIHWGWIHFLISIETEDVSMMTLIILRQVWEISDLDTVITITSHEGANGKKLARSE